MTNAIFTIGHSSRPLEELVEMLREAQIVVLADVRTVPRSRHNPQFNKETLPVSLAACGVRYVHLGGLGGLRRAQRDSPNVGWRNASFRGFADYMLTDIFSAELESFLETARGNASAIMCAEAVPWRCHRSLIADALVVRGYPVIHLLSPGHFKSHRITSFARIHGKTITYPSADRTGKEATN